MRFKFVPVSSSFPFLAGLIAYTLYVFHETFLWKLLFKGHDTHRRERKTLIKISGVVLHFFYTHQDWSLHVTILHIFSSFCIFSRLLAFNSENTTSFSQLWKMSFFLTVWVSCYTFVTDQVRQIILYMYIYTPCIDFFPPQFHCVEYTIFHYLCILYSGNFNSQL